MGLIKKAAGKIADKAADAVLGKERKDEQKLADELKKLQEGK